MPEQKDKEFAQGLYIKPPHPNTSFNKFRISIIREDLLEWLANKDGEWINLDVREAKSGKWYAEVNDFKRDGGDDDKPPF